MAAGFVGDIADQGFAPGLRCGLAGFVGGHGGVAGRQVLADDMRPGEIDEEAADAAAADDAGAGRRKLRRPQCPPAGLRRFPGVTDTVQTRDGARAIAGRMP